MSADDSILSAQGDTASAGNGGDGGAPGSGQAQGDQAQQQATDTGVQNQDNAQADDSILGKDPEADKADGDKKDGEGGKKDGDDKKDASDITPESYGTFETPDGMPVNEALLGEFKTVAADLKLSKEAAQKLVDLKVKEVQEQAQQWRDIRKGWVEEIKADKEFGGDNFDKTIHKANMALRQFDKDGGFLKTLKGTFEDHPETVKFLARVYDALGEDAVHTGRDAGKGKEVPLAQQLWKPEDMPAGVKI